jgi:hypothetical protein
LFVKLWVLLILAFFASRPDAQPLLDRLSSISGALQKARLAAEPPAHVIIA